MSCLSYLQAIITHRQPARDPAHPYLCPTWGSIQSMAPHVLKIDAAPFGLCYDPQKNNSRKESVRWLIMSPTHCKCQSGPPCACPHHAWSRPCAHKQRSRCVSGVTDRALNLEESVQANRYPQRLYYGIHTDSFCSWTRVQPRFFYRFSTKVLEKSLKR